MNDEDKDTVPDQSPRVTRALENFKAGASCAQAVLEAFSDTCGLDSETARRLASGFGAGMGRMREVCGAVSAMFMVASLKFGPDDFSDKKAKDDHYAEIQYLAQQFKQKHGSIICRELLPSVAAHKNSPVSDERTAEYYRLRPCARLVASAAEIIEEYLRKHQ